MDEHKLANRVYCHIDLDAFYAQVETKAFPQLQGQPVAVVQYNPTGDLSTRKPGDPSRLMNDSNGSLIAVNYEARASGVKRNLQGFAARKLCPTLQLVQVPTAHGKADLTAYRNAGRAVMDVLARRGACERASIDECYLDVTPEARRRLGLPGGARLPAGCPPGSVHVAGQEEGGAAEAWWSQPPGTRGPGEELLAAGAAAVAEARAAVLAELGFTCSAGIAHTKLLAKLASGLHKPAQQTLVPLGAVPGLLADLPLGKLRSLGGKFGAELQEKLAISTVGELAAVPFSQLSAAVGEKDATWLAQLARGDNNEEVQERRLPKSLSCGKTFRGHTALTDLAVVHQWLLELAGELEERLAEDRAANARTPRLLTLQLWTDSGGRFGGAGGSVSRSTALHSPTAAAIAADALALVRRWAGEQGGWALTSLFLAASNFVAAPTGASTLARFLKARPPPESPPGGPAGAAAGAAAIARAACVGGPEEQPGRQSAASALPRPADYFRPEAPEGDVPLRASPTAAGEARGGTAPSPEPGAAQPRSLLEAMVRKRPRADPAGSAGQGSAAAGAGRAAASAAGPAAESESAPERDWGAAAAEQVKRQRQEEVRGVRRRGGGEGDGSAQEAEGERDPEDCPGARRHQAQSGTTSGQGRAVAHSGGGLSFSAPPPGVDYPEGIDLEVLAALPPDIQQELREALSLGRAPAAGPAGTAALRSGQSRGRGGPGPGPGLGPGRGGAGRGGKSERQAFNILFRLS